MAALPQPRELLTSLINAISSIPLSQAVPANDLPGRDGPFHPFKAVPASHRHLLTTLHVLFPTLLLPALDLLDRRLVTRLIVVDGRLGSAKPGPPNPETENETETETTTATNGPGDENPPGDAAGGVSSTPLYLVRSARTPTNHPRRHHGYPPAAGNGYVVRLGAWNCACAAFAFAAFPTTTTTTTGVLGGGGGSGPGESASLGAEAEGLRGVDAEDDDGWTGLRAHGGASGRWSFGGASFDGGRRQEGEGVPCCKHLLACLLAERWHAALGGYVVEWRVGREEMAGIIADV